MTQQLAAAFTAASQLPDDEQVALAASILREIESERRWDELFARSESHELLSRWAAEAAAEDRELLAEPSDLN